MSLENILSETFDLWLNSFPGEISDDEEASRIWAGFNYALALARKEGEEKAKKKYENAHGIYSKPEEDIVKICKERESGYIAYQGEILPSTANFVAEEWMDEESDQETALSQYKDCMMQRYKRMGDNKKEALKIVLGLVHEKVVFWGVEGNKLWFTRDKSCYGKGDGVFFTLEIWRQRLWGPFRDPESNVMCQFWEFGKERTETLGYCVWRL